MRFSVAYNWMKVGKKMRTSGFKGFWFWDETAGELMITTALNETFPMKDTKDWDFTLGFINSDEWEFYEGDDDPRNNEQVGTQDTATSEVPPWDTDLERIK